MGEDKQNGVAERKLKIFFFAIDGIGHLNACVGIAQSLSARGHQITFLINEAFKGSYSKYGFGEILLTQKPTAPPSDQVGKTNPVKEMATVIKNMGFLGPKSPYEKLKMQLEKNDQSFMENMLQQSIEYNPQIDNAIKNEKPHLIILDTFLIPPSVRQGEIPWMLIHSPNPIYIYGSNALPPFGSGFPTSSDPATWKEFKVLCEQDFELNFHSYQRKLDSAFDFHPNDQLANGQNVPLSPFLNIYGFPEELDYYDISPRPKNTVAVDAFLRNEVGSFEIPPELANMPGTKLIYVSLGSMGSIDVDLMHRLLSFLAKTPYKYIVSKGQCGDEIELPPNCWGKNFLPQTQILPLCDLVITHGGNNTLTETFAFGKPMIVLPLFGDQYDNAQRVDEKGYGLCLEPYTVTETELISAIDQLLGDSQLQARAKAAAERIANSKSKEIAALRIEEVVAKAGK